MRAVEVRGLRVVHGDTVAVDGIDLTVEEGTILGLLGPNGSGKTAALHAILGLTASHGTIHVLGQNPSTERHRLMRDVAFVADVAVLPRWMRVDQAFDYMGGVHPCFDRDTAERLLARTHVSRGSQIKSLSRGMVAQVHLALALAIDAPVLVFDEPTLGLDAAFREHFYDTLLSAYLERRRTVLIATHAVDELEHVITDVAMLRRGRLALSTSMERLAQRFTELAPRREQLDAARALRPIWERRSLGQPRLLFDGMDRALLSPLGEVRAPALADLYAAVTDPMYPCDLGTP